MPPVDDTTRVGHILEAGRKAVRFAYRRNAADMEADEVLFLALTRLLEIIGEDAAGISGEFQARNTDIPWRQMAGMRNRLIHGYFDVEPRLVWETVTAELPPLIKHLQKVLDRESRH